MGGDEDEAGVVSITGTLICLVIDLKGDKKKSMNIILSHFHTLFVNIKKYLKDFKAL